MATLKYKTNNGYVPLPTQVVRKTNEENGFGIGVCSTAGGTAAKEVAITNYELVKNGFVAIRFTYDVPANATLNVNNKGAKSIYYKGSAITAGTIKADDTVMFAYDGTNYVVTSLGGGAVNPNETVNISLTQIGGNSADLVGAAVTITDSDTSETILTATWAGSEIITTIPVGTNYTVSVETISGYIACPNKSYMARYQTKRSITFQYRGYGVFVEATDGILYTSSSWAAAEKTANAVVLITASYKARICIIQPTTLMAINPEGGTTYSMTAITAENTAKGDTDGINNTQKILAENASTSDAAGYCNNYTFPDNNTKGYLPAEGELWLAYQNKTNIEACLTACNGDAFATDAIWSSTYYGVRSGSYMGFWRVNFSNGSCGGGVQSWQSYVRVFASYQ